MVMNRRFTGVVSIAVLLTAVAGNAVFSQEKAVEGYTFSMIRELAHTPVKNQSRTGTCWCFATLSFVESEAMRLGAEELDLSEMYLVRMTYPLKADNYVRLHGNATFGQGALSHDVMNRIRDYGVVPEDVYTGLQLGREYHDHGEMMQVLTAVTDAVIKGRRPSIRWREAFASVLDKYMGTPPETFQYNGTTYTPVEFAENVVKVNPDEYVEFTSFSHVPFYEKCRLQVPDNWDFTDDFYNVPLDDLQAIADHALQNGFTVAWDGDVSEKGFSSRDKGYAVVPKADSKSEPFEEEKVCQKKRQRAFDNYETTDDHLMHIVGSAEDQNGGTFYYIKNSGGDSGTYKGYLYMSVPYYRLKTTAIMVHKDAVPAALQKKLGL